MLRRSSLALRAVPWPSVQLSTRANAWPRLPARYSTCSVMVTQDASAGRGALIVFEGGDRCGKTTQTQMLVGALNAQGVKSELWRFPDRTTPIGKMINSYLTDKAAENDDASMHLLFAANRWEKRAGLLRALRAGTTLVLDRYSYSGVAFTAAKGTPGLDLQWCRAPEVGLPAPDALIYLNVSVEEAAARGGFGEERYETQTMQTAVRQQFDNLRDDSWRVVDAARSKEAIHSEVRGIALEAVEACAKGSPLRTLWDGDVLQE